MKSIKTFVTLFASAALSVGLLACVDMEGDETDEGVDTEAAGLYAKPKKPSEGSCLYYASEDSCNVTGQKWWLSVNSLGNACDDWICVDATR